MPRPRIKTPVPANPPPDTAPTTSPLPFVFEVNEPHSEPFALFLEPGSKLRIGREAHMDLCLQDVNVSRAHAVIVERGGRVTLRDLKSLNGTRVNGKPAVECDLKPGDVITVGDCSLLLRTQGASTADLPMGEPPALLEVIAKSDCLALSENVTREEAPGLETWKDVPHVREGDASPGRLAQTADRLMRLMRELGGLGVGRRREQIAGQFIGALLTTFPFVEMGALLVPDDHIGSPGFSTIRARSRGPRPKGLGVPCWPLASAARDRAQALLARVGNGTAEEHALVVPLFARNDGAYLLYAQGGTELDRLDLESLVSAGRLLTAALDAHRAMQDLGSAYESATRSAKEARDDRRAMMVSLSQSETRFRALFEQSALGAAVIRMDTRHLEEVNDGLGRMVGFSRRQFADMRFDDLIVAEDVPRVLDWLSRLGDLREGSIEARLRTSWSDAIYCTISARALKLESLDEVICYFADVTEAKRSEHATRTQLARITALGEMSQALMSTLDPAAIYRLIHSKVSRTLPVDVFVLARRSAETGRLKPVYLVDGSGVDGLERAAGLPEVPATGLLARVVERREPILEVLLPGETALHVNPFLSPAQSPEVTRSRLFVTIAARGEVLGVISAQSREIAAYDESQLGFLVSTATLAALALQNAELLQSLRVQQADLKDLSMQLLSAQEVERGRISRELHDGVGQSLTALRYELESMKAKARALPDSKGLLQSIGESGSLVKQVIEELRAISLDLRPAMLDDLGLGPTLEWFVKQFADRFGVPVDLEIILGSRPVPPHLATTVFRIVQEALGNVAKHARASRARLRLRRRSGRIELAIEDDGVGFDPRDLPRARTERGCSGILNLGERTHLVGGEFRLDAAPGKGTRLQFIFPLGEESDHAADDRRETDTSPDR